MRGARPGAALDAEVRSVWQPRTGACTLVACSGGPDSVGLALVVDRLTRRVGGSMVFAHVNHGLRPSAWQDEAVVLALGARLGWPVRIIALAPSRSDEASLRTLRYAALGEAARAVGAAEVLVAHVAEDQTETVLLALFRGTGLAGLAGMPTRRRLTDGVELVRPLLRVSRTRLERESFRSGLPYARDPSNRDQRYRRNALRPHLEALRGDFPHLDVAVARCAEIVQRELAGDERAVARRTLRGELQVRGLLRDVPFERIEAALAAGPRARVRVRAGVIIEGGEVRGTGD